MKKNEAAADPEKRDERRLKRKQIDKIYRMNRKLNEKAAAEKSETGMKLAIVAVTSTHKHLIYS
jgi:hypothetical protein